MSDDEKT